MFKKFLTLRTAVAGADAPAAIPGAGSAATVTATVGKTPSEPTVFLVLADGTSGLGDSLNVVPHAHERLVTGEGKCGPLAAVSLQADPANGHLCYHIKSWTGSYIRLFPKVERREGGGATHIHGKGFPFGVDVEGEGEDDLYSLIRMQPVVFSQTTTTIAAAAGVGTTAGGFLLQSALEPDTFLGFTTSMRHRVACAVGRSEAAVFRLQPSTYTLQSAKTAASSLGSVTKIAFTETPIVRPERSAPGVSLPAPAVPYPLSAEQKSAFIHDGYIIIRGAVPDLHVQAAVREINSIVGKAVLSYLEPGVETSANALQHSSHPVLVGLGSNINNTTGGLGFTASNTRVWAAVQAIIGDGKVADVGGCQVAPRFPKSIPERLAPLIIGADSNTTSLAALPETRQQGGKEHWHVDGMGKGVLCPFTLLCGVMLNDTLEDGCGQLTVYPGSHLELFSFAQAYGEDALMGIDKPRPTISAEPVELRMRAGDVVLAHPLLAHRVGVNYSSSIRYGIFFRYSHKEHAIRRQQILDGNMWAECEGVN